MNKTNNYYILSRPEIAEFVPLNIKSILDVGCSQGSFLQIIKQKTSAETWGVELIPEIAEKAKEKVDFILQGKIEDVIDLLPDNYFDCITFNDVLEHLIEPLDVLKLVKPKLTEKGIIIASIPNVRELHNLFNLLIMKDWKYNDYGILDSTHLRFFTKKSMKRLFESADYTIVKQEGINKLSSWKFKILNMFTFGIINDTRFTQYLTIATKSRC